MQVHKMDLICCQVAITYYLKSYTEVKLTRETVVNIWKYKRKLINVTGFKLSSFPLLRWFAERCGRRKQYFGFICFKLVLSRELKKSTTNAQGIEKLERSKLSKLNYVYNNLLWTNSVDAVFLSPLNIQLLSTQENQSKCNWQTFIMDEV